MEQVSGIYKITCLANNKCYIGQSVDTRRRLYVHKAQLNKNKHKNIYLQRLYNKYGKNFSPQTQFKKGSIPWNKGKKATTTAIKHQSESHLGHKLTDETKRKLSDAQKGKRLGKERYNAVGVLKIDTNGKVVAEYDTLTQAGLDNGIAGGNIKKRTEHSDRLYDNHYWKLKGESYERD